MIRKLKNPKSPLYYHLKDFIKSSHFPWAYSEKSTPMDSETDEYQDFSFYNHRFIERPRFGSLGARYLYPEVCSQLTDKFYPLLEEIFYENRLSVGSILRFSANCQHPIPEDDRHSIPHYDHQFPHKNLLIYLTDAGGDTLLFDDDRNIEHVHSPKEDDIIMFEGLHAYRAPKNKRRIVLVTTFI